MPKNPVTHVEGFEELNAALRRIGERATGLLLRNAAEAGAKVIEDEARRLAPRATGALADGISIAPGRLQSGRAQINVSFGAKQWYGRRSELGTKYLPARPFLRPAIDTKAEEAKNAVGASLWEALKAVLK